ncbi:MAG: MCE family protein [Polyangiaceae bacterium]|nr:MCE family protein [Polyangiaceae bacterium]
MAASRDLKVGIFVLAGLFLSALVIFLIGEERNLFDPSVEFRTSFTDVQGLKPGAPVRMGGLDLGQVSDVGYDPKAPAEATVYVTFWIKRSEAQRVKTDTRAKIANKGLLGDKMIELVPGESTTPAEPNALLEGDKPSDMFGKIEEMAAKAEQVMDNIEKATRPLGDEKLHQNIQGSVASVNTILKEVAEGDGYANKILSDPAEAERISATVKSLEGTAKEAECLIKDVRGVVGRVSSGPGFAHDLLYNKEGPKGVAEFASAANEVALTLKGIRENNSLAHDLLYGGTGDTAVVIKNFADLTGDLKAIVADIRAGKGTIGGLLVDPSIYEDVKIVLGNVQRNDVLRALVRYSINKDEPKPEVQVAGPK